jgi:hypothetical protein
MDECPRPPLQTVPVGGKLYAESGHETAFVDDATEVYDPCFGARTLIPRRFTETSIFSTGFADCARP